MRISKNYAPSLRLGAYVLFVAIFFRARRVQLCVAHVRYPAYNVTEIIGKYKKCSQKSFTIVVVIHSGNVGVAHGRSGELAGKL